MVLTKEENRRLKTGGIWSNGYRRLTNMWASGQTLGPTLLLLNFNFWGLVFRMSEGTHLNQLRKPSI